MCANLIIISFYISYLQQVQLRYAGAVRYIGLFDGRDESITAYNLAKECMLSFKSTNPTSSEIKKNHNKMRKAAYAAQYSSSDDDILFKPKAAKASKPVVVATSKVEGGKRGRGRPLGSKNVSKKVQRVEEHKSAVEKAVESGRMVSLAVAAASGCEKCIMELDDGIKTRHSHDDGCPRSRLSVNAKHKSGPNESRTRGRNPPTTVNNYAKSFATKPRQPPSSRREVRKPPPPPAPKSARLRGKVGPVKPNVAPPIRKVPIDPSIYKKAKETAASLPRGITERPSGKWQVQLYYLGKSRYIGVFDNRKDSAIGYELARAVMSSFKDKNPNPEQLKKNIMLMREAALSFKDAPLTPENSRKKQKTAKKMEASLPPVQTASQTQSAERSMRAKKRHRDEIDEASSGEEEEEEMPATKVTKTSENDGVLSTAEKCVGVVAHVLNSNKSLEELRNGGRDDIKDIVRPTLTFGNQFWKQIRILLQKALDAKEEGKTVDHASLLQMFYASNPETKPKTSPTKKASATTTASSSTEGTTFTTGTDAAAYHLSCSVRGGATEDLPEIGHGWLVNIIPRVGGERSDYYYFSPTGQRFRSMKQAKAYISESEGNVEFGSVGFSFKKMFTDKKGNDIGLYDGEVVDILSGNKVKCLYPADGYTEELSLSELKELVDIESKTLFDKLARLESKTVSFGSVGHKFTKEFPDGKLFDGVVVKVLKNVGKCVCVFSYVILTFIMYKLMIVVSVWSEIKVMEKTADAIILTMTTLKI